MSASFSSYGFEDILQSLSSILLFKTSVNESNPTFPFQIYFFSFVVSDFISSLIFASPQFTPPI